MKKKIIFAAFGVMVAVAAVLEFLIIHYHNPICTFGATGSDMIATVNYHSSGSL